MRIRAGFIPLVDAAVLVVAADRGFASAEGVHLSLSREVSWANIRDKLQLGHFDAAHMLAPQAIAECLELDYARSAVSAPLVLSQNGNSILFGTEAYRELAARADGDMDNPVVTGAALRQLIADRAARGEGKLTFAMTFPFSNHNYLLRFWMGAAGIDPDRDVNLVVLPPPYMVDSLTSGQVHGFCVGAPWPSVGIEAGIGQIVHFGTDILATCPEKVLGIRTEWGERNRDALIALTRALIRATAWCAATENRIELAHLLAAPGRLNLAPELILRALEGRITVEPSGRVRENARYLVIDSMSARPDARQALWLYSQMVRWGQAVYTPQSADAAAACFSASVYDEALHSMTRRPVLDDAIGAFTGPAFDPSDIPAYLGLK